MVQTNTERDRSLRDLVYFPVIFNVVGLVVTGIFLAVSPQHSIGSEVFNTTIYCAIFAIELLLGLLVLRKMKREGISIREFVLPKRKTNWMLAVLVFALLNAIFLTYMFLGLAYGYIHPMRNLSLFHTVFSLVLSPVTAGFVEELIWRGIFIEKILAISHSKARAIMYSSASFAFIHGFFLIDKLAVTFLLGIIAGAYYVTERNLPVLMISHAVLDVLSFALAIFVFA